MVLWIIGLIVLADWSPSCLEKIYIIEAIIVIFIPIAYHIADCSRRGLIDCHVVMKEISLIQVIVGQSAHPLSPSESSVHRELDLSSRTSRGPNSKLSSISSH